jgi:3-methylcrotonyl-CoA carboxylase alpha subunit
MPGQIVEVYVAPGDRVMPGQRLLVLEAMKMQQPVLAPYRGVVTQVPVARGDQVAAGQLLVHIDQTDE